MDVRFLTTLTLLAQAAPCKSAYSGTNLAAASSSRAIRHAEYTDRESLNTFLRDLNGNGLDISPQDADQLVLRLRDSYKSDDSANQNIPMLAREVMCKMMTTSGDKFEWTDVHVEKDHSWPPKLHAARAIIECVTKKRFSQNTPPADLAHIARDWEKGAAMPTNRTE